jgi:hypothetical protein
MKGKFFFSIIIIVGFILSIVSVFAATRLYRIHGSFLPDPTWSLGHPGKVTFDIDATNSGYAATIDESWFLSGYLWLGNAGWATFNHEDATCRAQIVCPEDILQNPNQICPIHGCIWSQNSGWLVLSGSMIPWYTWAYYNPNTALIEGFWWNRGLGWVPFYSEVGPVTPDTQTGITANGLNINFVGKIAIIGNIAGTRIFDLPNQNVGYVFTTSNHAKVMNTLQKNIALLTRNISDAILENPASIFEFMVMRNSDYAFDIANPIWPVNKRTIVVVGHDVVLDTTNNIGQRADGKTTALIVLKDHDGNGGNIIISDKVKQIYAFIYAEWSMISGEKSAGAITPYVLSGALNIPARQLYIKGLLISKNTIGWAQQVPTVCPVVINDCTLTNSQIYDLNYFRTYDITDTSQKSTPVWLVDPRLDNAPLIIDYDATILSDPPPGVVSSLE